jgi:hypothetical protein
MFPRGQSGNGTIAVILALFVVGLAGGMYFIFSPGAEDEAAKHAKDGRAAYDEAVKALSSALADQRAFDASLEHNAATFECLFSGDGNCRGRGGTFLLYESVQSRKPLSHLASDAGADVYGAPCKGFPSHDCPLRIETVWEPVCGGPSCDGTKSARVKAHVTLAAITGNEAPLEWSKDAMFTPQIQLSQAAVCARGGGEWTGRECLTPAQVAERRIASPAAARDAGSAVTAVAPPQEVPPPVQQVTPECPPQIMVQGQYYPVQFLGADRAQVTTPAMSCAMPGANDVFVFQCTPKSNLAPGTDRAPSSAPEGQWIQVEAVMAPACDQNGNPVGNLPQRF